MTLEKDMFDALTEIGSRQGWAKGIDIDINASRITEQSVVACDAGNNVLHRVPMARVLEVIEKRKHKMERSTQRAATRREAAAFRPTKFMNPANGYIERISGEDVLLTFFFGSFYLGFKGAWGQAFLSFFLAVFSCGLSWLIYPFFTKEILRRKYLREGWIPVDGRDAHSPGD